MTHFNSITRLTLMQVGVGHIPNQSHPTFSRIFPRWQRLVLVTMLLLTNLTGFQPASAAPSADTQPAFPIRAAFYYPWFPEAWNQQGFNPFTNYSPSLGFYDGGSQTVIKQQITAMQYGGIQAGIASWWGQGSRTDTRISALLQAAGGTSFRWSIYYEPESLGDPSITQLTNDLTYMRDHYGNDPSFLRIGGRFVVFVYADGADACGMADRWKQANTVGAYLVLKVFSGYRTCASQPDNWHQYSPAVAADSQKGYSYAIAPGFWKKGDTVRLARDLTRWNQNVRDMVASAAPFQLITTFNEWGEGTSVENATEWASSSGYGAYLDVLHNNGGQTTQPTATVLAPTNVATNTAQPFPTSVPTNSTARTFIPVADATVRESIPNTNYGRSTQLRIDSSPVIRSYLRFDVQGMGSPVTKATLRVYANSSSSAGYKVYKVSDTSWNEATINFNNAPALGGMLGAVGAFSGGKWTTVDVTSLITANGMISLALVGINSTAVSLASRETGANAPQLVVTTLTGTSPVTATPLPAQTALPTSIPTNIVPVTPTLIQISSPTVGPTLAFTATTAPTQIASSTSTLTSGLSATPLPTQIVSPTSVPTNVPAVTSTLTQTAVPTSTPTNIPSATVTPSKTPTQPSTPTITATNTWTPSPVATTSGGVVLVGAGDISSCGQNNDETTAKLLDGIAGTVFTAGDNAYDSGTYTEYTNCYDPTWGRNKARTKPVPGNHEYNTSGAAGYFQYFNSVPAYYAYNLGGWRIYALNSEIDGSATSAQVKWLQADLAANPSLCTLAYWHKPRWSSGTEHGSDSARQTLWQVLYTAGVELVINGHEHNYERFAEMNASGAAVSPGLREIVAGTGGQSHYGFGTALAASQVRNSTTFGVLKLTLRSNGYDWQFVPVPGATFTDSGSTNCH